MKTFTLTIEYSGEANSWEEIREDAENNKIKNVVIGTKKFVNVVRCQDCRYFKPLNLNEGFCNLEEEAPLHENDGYCSKGKRKEQNNEE